MANLPLFPRRLCRIVPASITNASGKSKTIFAQAKRFFRIIEVKQEATEAREKDRFSVLFAFCW
jgi:hypothetical protein